MSYGWPASVTNAPTTVFARSCEDDCAAAADDAYDACDAALFAATNACNAAYDAAMLAATNAYNAGVQRCNDAYNAIMDMAAEKRANCVLTETDPVKLEACFEAYNSKKQDEDAIRAQCIQEKQEQKSQSEWAALEAFGVCCEAAELDWGGCLGSVDEAYDSCIDGCGE